MCGSNEWIFSHCQLGARFMKEICALWRAHWGNPPRPSLDKARL